MSRDFTFLTNKEQNIKNLVTILEEYMNNCSNKNDLDIINIILKSFKTEDFSILSP